MPSATPEPAPETPATAPANELSLRFAGSISVQWDAVPGSESYQVEAMVDGEWVRLSDTSVRSGIRMHRVSTFAVITANSIETVVTGLRVRSLGDDDNPSQWATISW